MRSFIQFFFNIALAAVLLGCQKNEPDDTTIPVALQEYSKTFLSDGSCEETYSFRLNAKNWETACQDDETIRRLANESLGFRGKGVFAAHEIHLRDSGYRVPIRMCVEKMEKEYVKREAAAKAKTETEDKIKRLLIEIDRGTVQCKRPIHVYLESNPEYKGMDTRTLVDVLYDRHGQFINTDKFSDRNGFIIRFLSCYEDHD